MLASSSSTRMVEPERLLFGSAPRVLGTLRSISGEAVLRKMAARVGTAKNMVGRVSMTVLSVIWSFASWIMDCVCLLVKQ